jgi:hypothetical protein
VECDANEQQVESRNGHVNGIDGREEGYLQDYKVSLFPFSCLKNCILN